MTPHLSAAIGLGIASAAFAFAPPSIATVRPRPIVLRAGAEEEEPFDPFAQSPLSFGDAPDSDGGGTGGDAAANGSSSSTFGFLSYDSSESSPVAPANGDGEAGADFDPLLSPHAYAHGTDAAPVGVDETSTSAAGGSSESGTFGFHLYGVDDGEEDISTPAAAGTAGADLAFDPLLSPHAYANGIDAGPVNAQSDDGSAEMQKLGILLIDHGSRRKASNEHIHNVAKMYEDVLNQKTHGDGKMSKYETTVVRAAHMEIATPSISDSLKKFVEVDRVSKVVCVPYFLSPGRHATEDVPELIEEAREMMIGEDKLGDVAEVVLSKALGTDLEGMLGAVDHLVGRCLDEIEGEFL